MAKRASELEVKSISQGYLNAGFLLINLKRWEEEDISAQAIQLLKNNRLKNKFPFLDQDVLNILLTNKVIYLNKKYNTQYNINYGLQRIKQRKYCEGVKNYTHYYLAKFKILFKRIKELCLS